MSADEYRYQDEWRNDGREIGEENEHCEHDFEFAAEEEGVTLYGKVEWEWLFECPHCGAERAEKSPYSYWDKRNW